MQIFDEETLLPKEKEALDKALDEVVSVCIFHKQTLFMAGKDVKRRHINKLALSAFESYKKNHPDRAHSLTDFGIFIVNFETKNIAIQSIE